MDQSTDKSDEQAIAFIMDRYKAHVDGTYDLTLQSKRELLEIEANFKICENTLDYETNHGLYSFRKTSAILLGI
jgi:hypothetical protein